ncbi:MAG: hypothetical protein HYS13_04155 [Planctomycetia bacterium]|nr:hypothetical protein [Planctomycetia bacterium]
MNLRQFAIVFSLVLMVSSARAEVTRFETTSREEFAGGQSFGDVGPYERIVGRVFYAIDPKLRQNEPIVDLPLAPRNDQGKVEFFADLFILAPKDLAKGNGAALYDVNNRGNKLALRFFNLTGGGNDPRSAADAGDGFLLRHGFTIVWSGWDGELLPAENRLRLSAPVASKNGKPITGLVRCEIVPTSDLTRMIVVNWDNHGSYRPTERGLAAATLTHREYPGGNRVEIPRDKWKLHVTDVKSDSPSQLPKVEVEVPEGMKMGHIYEIIYEAQDPLVHGVCFAGVRDLVSAFRHGVGEGNPLLADGKPVIKYAYGFGVSQSGRFLRELVYAGFNEDEQGKRVFDGVIPHVSGAGLGSFNYRFAQPTRHVQQHDHHDYPADRFPFAYETQYDPLSKREDGILRRATATNTAPIVVHTQSAGEYWTRSGSLAHTDPLGTRDSDVPQNVRIYLFGGTQHGPAGFPPGRGAGKNLANPGDYRPFLRALLLGLDRQVRGGTPLPPSVYPKIKDGTLVSFDQKSTGFPRIPGVEYPQVIQQPSLWDYGPRWQAQRIIDLAPPRSLGDYKVLVPKCGQDGNELSCLSPPEVAVPVATYTGWNLRRADAGAENDLVSLTGSYIPFPATKAEREKSGDPRLSLEERYGTLDSYLSELEAKCRALAEGGYLLEEDIERIVKQQRERAGAMFGK